MGQYRDLPSVIHHNNLRTSRFADLESDAHNQQVLPASRAKTTFAELEFDVFEPVCNVQSLVSYRQRSLNVLHINGGLFANECDRVFQPQQLLVPKVQRSGTAH